MESITHKKPDCNDLLQRLRETEKPFLTATEVAPLLECDPAKLRGQAQRDPSKLPFPTIVIGQHVKFPRLAFLDFIEGVYGASASA